MALHAALAAAATLVSTAFALSTLERYRRKHARHELVWTISLALFGLGSLGLWLGATAGWDEWTYKLFFLAGAVLNVPFLALGTVYLLAERPFADRCTAVVSLLAAFAAGIVIAAPVIGTIEPDVLPKGSEVFGPGPRIAAAVGSGVPALVIFGGAVWSAFVLLRRHRRPAHGSAPAIPAGRLALANLLIAGGTLVLSAGGTSNSVLDAMDAFAVSLVVGIVLIFGGFLLTSTPTKAPVVEPWYPPALPIASAAPLEPPADEPVTAAAPPAREVVMEVLDLDQPHAGSPRLN
jgi:hypothetical protein